MLEVVEGEGSGGGRKGSCKHGTLECLDGKGECLTS